MKNELAYELLHDVIINGSHEYSIYKSRNGQVVTLYTSESQWMPNFQNIPKLSIATKDDIYSVIHHRPAERTSIKRNEIHCDILQELQILLSYYYRDIKMELVKPLPEEMVLFEERPPLDVVSGLTK